MVEKEKIGSREVIKFKNLIKIEDTFGLPEKKSSLKKVIDIIETFPKKTTVPKVERARSAPNMLGRSLEAAFDVMYPYLLQGDKIVFPGGYFSIQLKDVANAAGPGVKYNIEVKGQVIAFVLDLSPYYVSNMFQRGFKRLHMIKRMKKIKKCKDPVPTSVYEYANKNNIIYEKV
jgi:hypothetical protein